MNARQEKILELIQERKYISSIELMEKFHYSESTIRRDLILLEKLSVIKRVPGGAILIKKDFIEGPQSINKNLSVNEKRIIADLAIDFVADYQTIFLDSSTTVQVFSSYLNTKNHLNIVTPNLKTALLIEKLDKNHSIYTLGGEVEDGHINDAMGMEFLNHFMFDAAFFSARGFSAEIGTTERLNQEALIKQHVVNKSSHNILLLDKSKFDKVHPFIALKIDRIDTLVTDLKPSVEILESLETKIELVYP